MENNGSTSNPTPTSPTPITTSVPTIAVTPAVTVSSNPFPLSPSLPTLNITNLVTVKFDGTNYLLWKSQFENVLFTTDLMDHVDPTLIPPPEFLLDTPTTINPDYVDWRRKNRYLMLCLNATFTETIAQQVMSCVSAAEIWTQLQTIYLQQARASKTMLKERLSLLRKGNKSITTYLNELQGIAASLASINSPLEEDDIVIHALNGLAMDSNYDNLVVSLHNQLHVLTMIDLRSRLLVHEQWLTRSSSLRTTHLDSINPAAFSTQQRQNPNPKSSFNKNTQPQYSSRPNQRPPQHFPNLKNTNPCYPYAQFHPQPPLLPRNPNSHGRMSGFGSQPPRTVSPTPCQICKQVGHGAYNCRFRYYERSNNRASSSTSSTVSTPPLQAFNSLHLSNPAEPSEACIMDTGANSHMTSDPTLLHGPQSFDGPEKVMLGDGSSYRSGAS